MSSFMRWNASPVRRPSRMSTSTPSVTLGSIAFSSGTKASWPSFHPKRSRTASSPCRRPAVACTTTPCCRRTSVCRPPAPDAVRRPVLPDAANNRSTSPRATSLRLPMSDMPGGYAIMFSVGAMIAILLAALAATPEADASLAESLVRRLEERQARAQDMTARFVQSYRSGVLGKEVVERGVVRLKRPGRMLWEDKDPEKKIFLSDGRSYWFYGPGDRQVIVRDQDQERGVATRLLSGKGGLLEEFEARLDTPPSEGVYRLRLSPRKADPEVEVLFVDVDPGGQLRAIQVEDAQGN